MTQNFTTVLLRMVQVTLNVESDDEPTFGHYIHEIRNFRESNLLWPFMAVIYIFNVNNYSKYFSTFMCV